MRIPKYIDDALEKRAKTIDAYMKQDAIISKFITDNGIDVPLEDYGFGAEAFCNTYESNELIRDCITNHERNKQ